MLVVSALLLQDCSSAASDTAVGDWGVDAPGQPQLILNGDGRLTGTAGCNRLMGSWTENAGSIELSEMASTLMACEGVNTWLSGARSLEVDNGTLRVFDAGGSELGTLERG